MKNIPKYVKLKELIKELILNEKLKPGDIIESENNLSSRFGISRHTVRQAIGELVNENWLYREQGKGTFVSHEVGKNNHEKKMIGVMTTYIHDYIFPDIIKGIDDVLSQKGYSIILGCTNNHQSSERLCLESMKENNIAGLIAEPVKSALPNPNLELYKEIIESGIPVIFINAFYKELDSSFVVEDDFNAGYMATKHLLELGHRKIGGIFKVDDMQGHQRYKGYSSAYNEFNLIPNDASVLWFSTEDRQRLLDNSIPDETFFEHLDGCTAIVCYNDQMAVKLLDYLRTMNIHVPDDISIVSFDDSSLATVTEVKFTSVAHPKEKLGQKAALSLLSIIDEQVDHVKEKMNPELVIRGSTKAL